MDELTTNVTPNGSLKKIIIISVAVVVLLSLILGTSIALATPEDRILKGVKIDGISVGKQTKEEAISTVQSAKDSQLSGQSLTIVTNSDREQVPFSGLVLGYDVKKAVDVAYAIGRDGNFSKRLGNSIGSVFNKSNVTLNVTLDETIINDIIDKLAIKIDTHIVESSYIVEGNKLKLHNGKKGFLIKKDDIMTQIESLVRSGKSGEVTIAMVEASPQPLNADVIYEKTITSPTNAKKEMKNGKVFISSAKPGISYEKSELQKVLVQNAEDSDYYYLDVLVTKPSVDFIGGDGLFGEILASFTSILTDKTADRLNNVRLAAKHINGTVLNPGEVFSYNNSVGPVTLGAGFKIAKVYLNGKIETGVGGGVCQVSSALYSTVLNANLEVIKRYNHSLTVGYVPYGQDATVSSGEVDFRFKNNTNAPIKIVAGVDGSGVNISLLGEKPIKGLTVKVENIKLKTIQPKTVIEEDPTLPAGKVVIGTNGKAGYVIDTYKNIYINGVFKERVYVSKSTYKVLDTVEKHGTIGEPTGGQPQATQAPNVDNTPQATTAPTTEPTNAPTAAPTVKPENTPQTTPNIQNTPISTP